MMWNLVSILISIIDVILDVYSLAIVVDALMSWVPQARFSRFGQLINRIVSPLIGTIQRIIPSLFGLDFSPVIALLLLQFARWGIERILIVLFSLF